MCFCNYDYELHVQYSTEVSIYQFKTSFEHNTADYLYVVARADPRPGFPELRDSTLSALIDSMSQVQSCAPGSLTTLSSILSTVRLRPQTQSKPGKHNNMPCTALSYMI